MNVGGVLTYSLSSSIVCSMFISYPSGSWSGVFLAAFTALFKLFLMFILLLLVNYLDCCEISS